jgi:anti-sigma B factor antagonist
MGETGERGDARSGARALRPPSVYGIEERRAPAGVVLLALTGEFDVAAAPAARARFEEAQARRPRGVVLDMAEVTFTDSSALRELLAAHAALQAERARLIIAAPPPMLERVLEVTRARDLLEIVPTVETALRRLAAPA